MTHHDEDDGPCNRHAAGSIEPRRRVDYRAKKHPRPNKADRNRYKMHPRQTARRQAGAL